MRFHSVKAALACAAAFGLAAASPAFAAAANRSADSLPAKISSIESVPYSEGIEKVWTCGSVNKDNVRVDAAGRMVVDAQGAPFKCSAPTSSFISKSAAPFAVAGGIVGIGAIIIAVTGKKDSPG